MNSTRANQSSRAPRKRKSSGQSVRGWGHGLDRRGNTIVLVAGILVLLVIIATSYLTRTQSQRTVSVATSDWQGIDATASIIADKVAEEIGLNLFVRPVDPELYNHLLEDLGSKNLAMLRVRDANLPRLHPTAYEWVYGTPARRYNIDHNFPFNFAPYHTVPWTNWPDPLSLDWDVTMWPAGPGNPHVNAGMATLIGGAGKAFAQGILASEHNPIGNPGFGDNRLLADIEPVRINLSGSGDFGGAEAFSHWRKISYLPSSSNGWRAIADVSDVLSNIVHDLNIPVEQWPAARPNNFIGNVGSGSKAIGAGVSNLASDAQFLDRWRAWFGLENAMPGGQQSYQGLYMRPALGNMWTLAPGNFYNLRNLNASPTFHVDGDRPRDEFTPGTRRHRVSRVLADTTGDGFTDALWFLPPVPVRNGVMTIAAVRIVDNSAMLNMNVAGQFQRNDLDSGNTGRSKTRGTIPGDLAAVGQFKAFNPGDNAPLSPPAAVPADNFRVGLYDNSANWFGVQQYPEHNAANSLWNRHVNAVGFWRDPTAIGRRDYWRLAGRLGLDQPTYQPGDPSFRPFGLGDEVELRMFEGNNHPWILTRFEQTTQWVPGSGKGILRAALNREESSEYLDQLTNVARVRDLRSKVTLYNGARNDLLPPWLWWENRYPRNLNEAICVGSAINPDALSPNLPAEVRNALRAICAGATDQTTIVEAYDRFEAQTRRKVDLREMLDHLYEDLLFLPNNAPGTGLPDYYSIAADAGRLNFAERLAPTLMMALTDDHGFEANRFYGSYFGPYVREATPPDGLPEWDPISPNSPTTFAETPAYTNRHSALNMTRRLAAAWAANIRAYRSNQPPVTRDDVVELPKFQELAQGQLTTGSATRTGYLPITPQPFITEVFVGHVYKSSETRPEWYKPGADQAMCDDPNEPGTHTYNTNLGNRLIFDRGDDDPYRSAVVVVQIANPFDVPIDLRNYRLRVMGTTNEPNTVQLNEIFEMSGNSPWLEPAREGRPTTAIFYAIRSELSGDPANALRERWKDFLDIDITNPMPGDPERAGFNDPTLPPGTLIVNVGADTSASSGLKTWTREPYDVGTQTVAIERLQDGVWIAVDRIDPPSDFAFRNSVRNMGAYRPMTFPLSVPLCAVTPDLDTDALYPTAFPTYHVRTADDHWVQWVRATRAWGVDLNGNGAYEAHERNPRFVFGDRAIVVPTWYGTPDADDPDWAGPPGSAPPPRRFTRPRPTNPSPTGNPPTIERHRDAAGGNIYRFSESPNADPADANSKPWFARTYYNVYGDLVDGETPSTRTLGVTPPTVLQQRKPTFFALGWREGQWRTVASDADSRAYFMPDKGWYGQFKINLRDDPQVTAATFRTHGTGWGLPGVDPSATEAEPPTSGVDDPTVLFSNMRLWNDTTLAWGAADLSLFRQPYSMQMALKNKHIPDGYTSPTLTATQVRDARANRDFEQVGELLNVWLFGHEITYTVGGSGQLTGINVRATFAEHMSRAQRHATLEQSEEPYLWALTGGTPDFNVTLNPGTANQRTPYQRYLDWLADPEKNRINRLRLSPWEFRAYPTPLATQNNDPANAVDFVLGDIIARPRVNGAAAANPELLYFTDPRQAVPALPAGVRVLDAFVCDGPGSVRRVGNEWHDNDGNVFTFEEVERRRFFNANGFTGKATPGLININTAPHEVLRTKPHMTRLVHELQDSDFSLADNPFPEVMRALVRYRERFGDPTAPDVSYAALDSYNLNQGPAYAHRGRDRDWFRPGGGDAVRALYRSMRGDRGLASIGELMLLTQPGRVGKQFPDLQRPDERFYLDPPNQNTGFTTIDFNSSWRIDYAAMPDRRAFEADRPNFAPFPAFLYGVFPGAANLPPDVDNPASLETSSSARISTDVVEEFDDRQNFDQTQGYPRGLHPDLIAEDAQESNLLFAGISNLVTTRSDVFTVYMRVRSFRQNPVTGRWDATDPDYIVDDSRYVMLVDRSNVNSPTDKPKILYLEKLPK